MTLFSLMLAVAALGSTPATVSLCDAPLGKKVEEQNDVKFCYKKDAAERSDPAGYHFSAIYHGPPWRGRRGAFGGIDFQELRTRAMCDRRGEVVEISEPPRPSRCFTHGSAGPQTESRSSH